MKNFHKAFRAALNLDDKEIQQCLLLPVGWNDGGCFGLAAALHAWTDQRALPMGLLKVGDDILQHGLVSVSMAGHGLVMLDGDGVSTPGALLKRWRVEERVGRCFLLPVPAARIEGAAQFDLCVDIPRLTIHLQKTLGKYSDWGIASPHLTPGQTTTPFNSISPRGL